jgi:secreted PhoX family phosphatase
VNLSSLTDDQDFSSPDGLWFSRNTGLCCIQTDDGAYTDVTNCMMLAAVRAASATARRARCSIRWPTAARWM